MPSGRCVRRHYRISVQMARGGAGEEAGTRLSESYQVFYQIESISALTRIRRHGQNGKRLGSPRLHADHRGSASVGYRAVFCVAAGAATDPGALLDGVLSVRFGGFVTDDVVDQFDPAVVDVATDCLSGAGSDRLAHFLFCHGAVSSACWQRT